MYDEGKLYRQNMTAEERQDAHKNLMSYSDDFSIDIPPRQGFLKHCTEGEIKVCLFC